MGKDLVGMSCGLHLSFSVRTRCDVEMGLIKGPFGATLNRAAEGEGLFSVIEKVFTSECRDYRVKMGSWCGWGLVWVKDLFLGGAEGLVWYSEVWYS